MPMPASMLGRSRLLTCDILAHSIRICPDRCFFMSLTVPAILVMPLWVAKGESLATDASLSNDSIMISHGQSAAFRHESKCESMSNSKVGFGLGFFG